MGITDMSKLFADQKKFNADISNWNTSGVTDMYRMFGYAAAFNQPLSFDTSSVTNMGYMFLGAAAFNQPLSFDTSSVTNMHGIFYNAEAFNQPLSFDTSSVTGSSAMDDMFSGASSLSATNKLIIRCAWADTMAFASAGYDEDWAPGGCD